MLRLKYQCCDMVVQGKTPSIVATKETLSRQNYYAEPRGAEELEVATYNCIATIENLQ